MTEEVYTLQKDVKHEDTTLLGIFENEAKAIFELEEEAEDSRFEESRRWTVDDDNDHILSVKLLDVTLVVQRWEVE